MLHPPRTFLCETAVDAADLFITLFPEGDAVWLDSGPGATEGRSILGTGTLVATASVADGTVSLGGITAPGSILDVLRSEIADRRIAVATGLPLGWAGWLGYEAGAAALGMPVAGGRGHDAAFLLLDRLAVIDHAAGQVLLIDARDPESSPWLHEATGRLLTADGAAERYLSVHPIAATAAHATWRHTSDEYRMLLASCQDAIRTGDAYQLCLTNTATARTRVDPLAVHLRLRRASPSHHAGFLRIAGETLVSSSPEQFLQVQPDGLVRTKPIKGTRPRGATPSEDERLRAELAASEKERAENVMIVDLMRNDLGRVCRTGSVAVRELLAVESYAQVHQLVSTVEGQLRPGLDAVDAIAACFPAGSMTGAPKRSAMRILNRLEDGPRGTYAGCFGLLGSDGSADLAMVIRSIRFQDGLVTIGSGGGITALSVPDEELAEVQVKAAALLRAVGLRTV